MEFSQYQVNALLSITNRPSLVFTEGHGMWLTDHSGKRYLDYLQGWAVNCLGHAPQCIQDGFRLVPVINKAGAALVGRLDVPDQLR